MSIQESYQDVSEGAQNDRSVPLLVELDTNPEAFTRLYREHYDGVFRYCVHRLFNRTIALDITAEVFLKVVENIRRFRGNEEAFRGWLFRIATNTINSYLREKLKQEKLLKGAAEYASALQPREEISDEARREKLALLKRAMLSLKPHYQTIITLRFFEKMSYSEIADVLVSSPGTVRSQVSRGLAKLRKKMTALEKSATPEV